MSQAHAPGSDPPDPPDPAGRLLWGDLHNHCAISYGHGSLERALALARQQLDFVSVTGHAFWPDMPTDRTRHGRTIDTHRMGFQRLHAGWDGVLATLAGADREGEFVVFPGYEWHSLAHGDHHVVYRDLGGALLGGETVDELRATLRRQGRPFLLVPHHIGYPRGVRGTNWDTYAAQESPLVELYSLHGCSESDEAPYPMLHTMGPRDSRSTVQEGLNRGHRFGFLASTDQHSGYPGSYGEGRLALRAAAPTRAAIWDALLSRRTYAVTGDKIEADFAVNGAPLGGQTTGSRREIAFAAAGSDFWDTAEVLKNGRVWRRWAPTPSWRAPAPDRRLRSRLRVEWGWGRAEPAMPWELRLAVDGGAVAAVETCFRGEPVLRHDQVQGVEETIPHALLEQTAARVAWRSLTRGNHSTRHPTTQALILTLDAPPSARIHLTGNGLRVCHTLAQLLEGSRAHMTAGFASPAVRLHRAVAERDYRLRRTAVDTVPEREVDYYYLRLAQRNAQCAWLSPVWVTA
jgi:hypothetical protein